MTTIVAPSWPNRSAIARPIPLIGSIGGWLVDWFAVDLVYRVVIGILVGIGVGWVLSYYVFHYSDETQREETREGLMVMAAGDASLR